MSSESNRRPNALPGRLAFRIGLAMFTAGLLLFLGWMALGTTRPPWLSISLLALSVPALGYGLLVRFTLRRLSAAAPMIAVAAVLDYLLVFWAAFPAYRGPVQVGARVPPFAVEGIDGAVGDERLRGRRTLLVFFRGKW